MEDLVEYAISELDRVDECDAANSVRQMQKELRKTKRALWLARAERASSEKAHYYIMSTYCEPHSHKQKWMKRISFTWEKVERKCREKAEEHK